VGDDLGQVGDGVVMYSLHCACSCDVIDYSMPDVHIGCVSSRVGGGGGRGWGIGGKRFHGLVSMAK
jgi:hypothetical protein